MAVLHYRELIAWQRAMDMVAEVYRISRQFPREELYGLTNQIRRAAVSVPSNIAEGQGRGVGQAFCRANGTRRLARAFRGSRQRPAQSGDGSGAVGANR